MRILFVTSNRLGDAVLSTGLLDHLLRTHPDARFIIVCGPVAEGVFARMPNRDRTIVLQKQKWGLHWLRLWAQTATVLWDLVVDIRGSALSWLVPTRRRATLRRIAGPKVAQLGAMLNLSPPPLPVTWIDDQDRGAIAAIRLGNGPVIVLAPTANWLPKVWPPERFAEAFHALAKSLLPDATAVVLAGPGPAERAMAEPLLRLLPGARAFVGALSLPEAAALLRQTALFIGNDSGLMHLSAAAGAPTIGIFGPTDAAVYGPAGHLARAVTGPSMEAVTVQQVVAAAERLLSCPVPETGLP